MPPRRRVLLLGLAFAAAPRLSRAADPLKIAFVDTGNTGRSLMAETLARAIIQARHLPIAVISRGLDVDPFDEAPEPFAAQLMAARGFDIAAHRARPLEPADIAHADLIPTMPQAHADKVIAMAPAARGKTYPLALYATGVAEPIPDAWGKPVEVYQAVVAQLDRLLPLAVGKAASLPPS